MPSEVPVVPISGGVLYPFMVVPFYVRGARAEKAVDAAMSAGHFIFAAGAKNLNKDIDELLPEDLYEVGTVGLIHRMMRVPTGGIKMMVQGLQRAKSTSYDLKDDGYIASTVDKLQEKKPEMNTQVQALIRNLNSQLEEAAKLGKNVPQEFLGMVREVKEPGKLADLVASVTDMQPGDAQNVLEELDEARRLELVSRILAGEIELLEVQNKINTDVKEGMEDTQRKYYLKQQLEAIQKELGMSDPKSSEVAQLKEKVKEAQMPEKAEEQALKEIGRLENMHPDSAEAGVVRTYIEWMTSIPWSVATEDNLDLNRAEKVLDEDHYGLEKIKERIVETLAVRKLKPDLKGAILCFVGPPGVGKTSLGQSIARALERKFIRMSVGGVRDEAEIRGHRRTYVGAMPGRIISNLKNAGSRNPVFMIDEIDKMGSDFRGDPSSAMLEVLDPQQNDTFVDHYLDVPFDLSDIMFITTANVLHTIPGPLRDRMEVIQLEGYTEEEKVNIASKYLVPRQIEANGLKKKQITFHKDGLSKIIQGYTREAGVRNLEREIGKVCRKVATKIAKGEKDGKYKVKASNIYDYLGASHVEVSKKREKDEIGVVNGLAWTQTGGDVLHIEAMLVQGKGPMITTGQLGDVMKESVQAALSLSKKKAVEYGFENLPDENSHLHVHVPSGAVPKDGPSAGVTMFSALFSLITGIPARNDVAMTGEISLRGAVMPIGGLKSKLLAAKREGIKTALVPDSNRNDVDEMRQDELKGLKIIYLKTVDDIIPHIFRKKLKTPGGAANKPAGKSRKKAGSKKSEKK